MRDLKNLPATPISIRITRADLPHVAVAATTLVVIFVIVLATFVVLAAVINTKPPVKQQAQTVEAPR